MGWRLSSTVDAREVGLGSSWCALGDSQSTVAKKEKKRVECVLWHEAKLGAHWENTIDKSTHSRKKIRW
jgi:hypothetical protein